jgi:hypothetical protein
MLESGNKRERIKGNENFMETIPSTGYCRSKNRIMWNILTIWVAGQQMMQDVHVKLDTGLPWQKQP